MSKKAKQDSANIYDRISRGDFTSKKSSPAKPQRPAVLDIVAGKLTAEQLATIGDVKAAYDTELLAYRADIAARQADDNYFSDKFRVAILADCGMDPSLKISNMLYEAAYHLGHSSGYHDVACHMHDLVEIYHEAIRMRDEATASLANGCGAA